MNESENQPDGKKIPTEWTVDDNITENDKKELKNVEKTVRVPTVLPVEATTTQHQLFHPLSVKKMRIVKASRRKPATGKKIEIEPVGNSMIAKL